MERSLSRLSIPRDRDQPRDEERLPPTTPAGACGVADAECEAASPILGISGTMTPGRGSLPGHRRASTRAVRKSSRCPGDESICARPPRAATFRFFQFSNQLGYRAA